MITLKEIIKKKYNNGDICVQMECYICRKNVAGNSMQLAEWEDNRNYARFKNSNQNKILLFCKDCWKKIAGDQWTFDE